jgi:class 3 adenylate cyclase/pSer/pThr/pTyr-binding forkhead associated (FHA) protein
VFLFGIIGEALTCKPAKKAMAMIIHYSSPDGKTSTFKTEADTVILGRNPCSGAHVDIDLVADEHVSHQHSRLTFEHDQYWVEDLDSANGTWVNGVLVVRKTRLSEGDRIRVGWTRLTIQRGKDEGDGDFDIDYDTAADPGTEPGMKEAQKAFSQEEISVPEIVEQADGGELSESESNAGASGAEDLTTQPCTAGSIRVPEKASLPEFEQVRSLSELSRSIGAAESLESLMQTLEKNLKSVISNAQRGAVLLPDGKGKLLLKAHWPPGEHSVSMTWIKQAFERRSAFVWSAPLEDAAAEDTPDSVLFYKVQSAVYVPLMVGEEALGVMYVDNFYSRGAFSETDLELMKTLASQVAMFIKDRVLSREHDRESDMRSIFSRQFPPRIAEILAGKYSHRKVGGERVDPVTILVSDVRNFTALTTEMEPDAVVRMINEMFDALVPIIFEYDGVVDKFVGDSVLAVFGSPLPDDHQWEKAVRAALEMQKAVHMLGEGRRVRRLPVFEVGISIHSGEVIHGFIGSRQRTEYTIIGDAVNKASRYNDGAGSGEIVISEPVFEQVYSFVDVVPKIIRTKHSDIEPDLKAYLVKGLREGED